MRNYHVIMGLDIRPKKNSGFFSKKISEVNIIQWSAGHSDSVHVNPTPHIFVISQPKWLKFGLQAHLFKMFGHAKFQLSISCTFIVMKHLVEITKYTTKTFITLKVQEIES